MTADHLQRPPTCFSDRKDEAMDMLLHIYDMYTDEELEPMLD